MILCQPRSFELASLDCVIRPPLSHTMIAVLGWGSLIWDPRELVLENPWVGNGPMIRVDYLRRSSRNRVTLVLHQSAAEVPSLSTSYAGSNWTRVRDMLVLREGVTAQPEAIHHWTTGEGEGVNIAGLPKWAESNGVDHVLWTALPPRWDRIDGRVPTLEQVVGFLEGLRPDRHHAAEEYVRRTPAQVMTTIREAIQVRLGWTTVPPDKDAAK